MDFFCALKDEIFPGMNSCNPRIGKSHITKYQGDNHFAASK